MLDDTGSVDSHEKSVLGILLLTDPVVMDNYIFYDQ